MKVKSLLKIFGFCFLIVTLLGCEAFVRKFTRKPKHEVQEPMVLAPEEYKSNLTKEELYRQYFMFWKSWQDEIINALDIVTANRNQKKPVDCTKEALKNLLNMRAMLKADKQAKLDAYISRMQDLLDEIEQDIYGTNTYRQRQKAERLKMDIQRDFIYPKIKDALI
jgi:hypothetical protein